LPRRPGGLFADSGQELAFGAGRAVALGDMDGDGDLDVFIANSPGPNIALLNDGTSQFSDEGHRLGGADSIGMALGDLDDDGDLDALAGNEGDASRVWLNIREPGVLGGALRCEPGQVQLFFDDFEDGVLDGWDLADVEGRPTTAGWEIVLDGDNHVLAGSGHNWAVPPDAFGENAILHLKIRAGPDSAFHVNVRLGEACYYIAPGSINRDPGEVQLADWPFTADDRWHEMAVQTSGPRVQLFWDGALVADVEDSYPVPGGQIGLENTAGTTWYDDILLCALPATGE